MTSCCSKKKAPDDEGSSRPSTLHGVQAQRAAPLRLVLRAPIADIDHFKAINDSLGHDAGDQALCLVAASLAGGLRGGDLCGRWGGEELGILSAAADPESVRALGERLRVLVARSRFTFEGHSRPVRVSLGGALVRPDDTALALLAGADEALYRAKETGRDRVVVAPN